MFLQSIVNVLILLNSHCAHFPRSRQIPTTSVYQPYGLYQFVDMLLKYTEFNNYVAASTIVGEKTANHENADSSGSPIDSAMTLSGSWQRNFLLKKHCVLLISLIGKGKVLTLNHWRAKTTSGISAPDFFVYNA